MRVYSESRRNVVALTFVAPAAAAAVNTKRTGTRGDEEEAWASVGGRAEGLCVQYNNEM